MSFWVSFWNRYSWSRVRDRIRSLPGRLGFGRGRELKFFGLTLDLEGGALYDNVLERYLSDREAAGVYFILTLYAETRDDVGESSELVSLTQLVPEHCLDCPPVRKNVEVFAKLFSRDPELLYRIAKPFNYTKVDIGDVAIKVYALPRVSMVLALWMGEEGIPSSVQILFDKNAPHYLSEDSSSRFEALMGLTRALTGRLIMKLAMGEKVSISPAEFGGIGYIAKG